ncbi:hypothetical protein Dimus_022386 [Dionaea muscipula]
MVVGETREKWWLARRRAEPAMVEVAEVAAEPETTGDGEAERSAMVIPSKSVVKRPSGLPMAERMMVEVKTESAAVRVGMKVTEEATSEGRTHARYWRIGAKIYGTGVCRRVADSPAAVPPSLWLL